MKPYPLPPPPCTHLMIHLTEGLCELDMIV